jgi:hypothetical protein
MSLQPHISALLFHLEAFIGHATLKTTAVKALSLRLCCGHKIQLKYNIITKQCNSKVWLYVYFTPGFRIVNKELYALYSSSNIIRVIKSRRLRWAGHVARMGRGEVHTGLVGKPEEKKPLGRRRRRWEDNIKMDLREVRWGGGIDRIDLAQDRDRWRALVYTVMNLRVT